MDDSEHVMKVKNHAGFVIQSSKTRTWATFVYRIKDTSMKSFRLQKNTGGDLSLMGPRFSYTTHHRVLPDRRTERVQLFEAQHGDVGHDKPLHTLARQENVKTIDVQLNLQAATKDIIYTSDEALLLC